MAFEMPLTGFNFRIFFSAEIQEDRSLDFGDAARLTRGVAGRFREKRQLHCELVPAAPCALISAS